uniref:Uncharacterized protein n=1 Tax=Rhizophora mucronata TaxID=61149 RepID=A0A2P2R3A2_RHIMU
MESRGKRLCKGKEKKGSMPFSHLPSLLPSILSAKHSNCT